MRTQLLIVVKLFCGAALLVACGASGSGEVAAPGTPTGPGTPSGPAAIASIVITPAGPLSLAAGGTAQITATAYDGSHTALAGQSFTYATSDPARVQVSSSGLLTAVGPVGDARITAAASAVVSESLLVHVTHGAPATLSRYGAAPPVAATAGSAYGDSVRVVLQDAYGNPVPGVSVTFTVTTGSGSASPASALTDAQGHVATVFTTGVVAGVNTLTVTAPGMPPGSAPLTVNTTSTPIPVARVSIAPSAGYVQLLVLDSGSTLSPTVVALDAQSRPISGAVVNYLSRTPGTAAVSQSGTVTGAAHGQATLLATSGTASDSATVIVTPPNGIVVAPLVPGFAVKADTVLTVPVEINMRNVSERLGAATVTVTWDPAVLAFQSAAAYAGGPASTLNTAQASTGTLTLSFADATGFTGRIPVVAITFHATASAGHTGAITATATELTAAASFTNLTPRAANVVRALLTR